MSVNQSGLLEEGEYTLIEGCISGNRRCQNALYERYAGKMLTVCLRYASSREEAEDNLQEGFIKIFDHIRDYRGTGSFEGWMRKIIVNTCLEKCRKEAQLHSVINLDNLSPDNLPSEEILSRIRAKELIGMVGRLSPGYRIVFNLYVFEGLKHKEIAEMLGISEGTSKSNLSNARLILQKMVENSLKVTKRPNGE